MKILLNSIGQTLQKHGPGLTNTHTHTKWWRREWVWAAGRTYVDAMWRPVGQRPPQQTTKNCIAIFTRNLFCGNIVKVFRTEDRLPRWRHLAKLHTNVCACIRVCVCVRLWACVCGCDCCLGQMANGNWLQMLYIFICLRYALISDCLTFYLMPEMVAPALTEMSAKLNPTPTKISIGCRLNRPSKWSHQCLAVSIKSLPGSPGVLKSWKPTEPPKCSKHKSLACLGRQICRLSLAIERQQGNAVWGQDFISVHSGGQSGSPNHGKSFLTICNSSVSLFSPPTHKNTHIDAHRKGKETCFICKRLLPQTTNLAMNIFGRSKPRIWGSQKNVTHF